LTTLAWAELVRKDSGTITEVLQKGQLTVASPLPEYSRGAPQDGHLNVSGMTSSSVLSRFSAPNARARPLYELK
jgi:hypothetical protein